jgi:NDP-sugar pyrophosphorylase family protein
MLDPVALDLLLANTPCDMTILIQRLVDNGYPVLSFPVMEEWLDVGRMSDFEKAQCDFANYRRGEK